MIATPNPGSRTRVSPALLDLLVCPRCRADLIERGGLVCSACGATVPVRDGKPHFSLPPADVVPSAAVARGPRLGNSWRQANWRFYDAEARRLKPGAVVLDLGAGHADCRPLFSNARYVAADFFPYPEVDFVADLTVALPLRSASIDAAVLSNVLEHVADPVGLLRRVRDALRPGGCALIAVPFMIGIHQAPFDFGRYTHHLLPRQMDAAGLRLERIEACFDPVGIAWARACHAQALTRGVVRLLATLARVALGIAARRTPSATDTRCEADPWPVGYHLVASRPP